MTTPLLGLSEIAEGVVNQTTLHNMALRQIEARIFRALSMSTATPAVGPAEGDSYIIPAGATGAWSGKTNQVASYIGGGWSYFVPVEGVSLWVNDEDDRFTFDGSDWIAANAGVLAAIADHEAASDPHPGYLTQAEGDARYAATGSGETVTTMGALINGATAKTTPVDADYLGLMDSAASNVLKKLSWANVKATLKTYFDTLYATATQPFDVHAFYPGIPTASAKVVRVPVGRAVAFAANFAGSYGKASAAATASTAFDVQKNGVSIGTITFALGATTATFATAGGASQSLAAGDIISIIAPATPDATLADPGFVLVGTR